MKIKRVHLDDIESQILTGLIVSKDFLKKVRVKLRAEHLKSNYGNYILKWCYEYWDKYEEAPEKNILRIFKSNKKAVRDKTEAKILKLYLQKLSGDYERQSHYNVEYLYDKLIDYIRKRDIENLVDRLNTAIENEKIDRASEELISFQLIHRETSKVFNPFSKEYIEQNWDDEEKGIVELPGALGRLIGPLDRGWLVSFTAPEKRGKTWWLIEMAFQALSQKRNVLFVSLEMPEKDIRNRLWKRMTAGAKKSKVLVPVLDCKYSQTGECPREDLKESDITLHDEDDEKPDYRDKRNYRPCTVCREMSPKDLKSDFWYERVRASEYDVESVVSKSESMVKQFGDSFRVKCFPAYTANVTDIKALIDELEVNEGFTVDVLITDYLDITGAESTQYSERGNIDMTWKMGKSLAAIKSLLHITVDQSSKLTYEKDIRLYDTSEDKRKNAHVDVKVSINVFPDKVEIKDIQILRFSVLAHRHRSFKTFKEVVVLQQLGIGQPLIDCEKLN